MMDGSVAGRLVVGATRDHPGAARPAHCLFAVDLKIDSALDAVSGLLLRVVVHRYATPGLDVDLDHQGVLVIYQRLAHDSGKRCVNQVNVGSMDGLERVLLKSI